MPFFEGDAGHDESVCFHQKANRFNARKLRPGRVEALSTKPSYLNCHFAYGRVGPPPVLI
jgi:hypothetical protein